MTTRDSYAFVPGRKVLADLVETLQSRAASSIGKIPASEVVRAINDLLGAMDDDLNEVWTPFEPSHIPDMSNDQGYILNLAQTTGASVRVVIESLKKNAELPHYRNNLYQVVVEPIMEDPEKKRPRLIHLSIKRTDQKPIRDWRHLQRIKNEICGPRFEAVELFPADARLVDTANQYHLWVFGEPDTKWGFGWDERLIVGANGVAGSVQRVPEDPTEWRRILVSGDFAYWQPTEKQWAVFESHGGSIPKSDQERLYVVPAGWTHEMMNHANALYHLGIRKAEHDAALDQETSY